MELSVKNLYIVRMTHLGEWAYEIVSSDMIPILMESLRFARLVTATANAYLSSISAYQGRQFHYDGYVHFGCSLGLSEHPSVIAQITFIQSYCWACEKRPASLLYDPAIRSKPHRGRKY